MTAAGGVPVPAEPAGGSIYDLGYQGYDGPRLGRRYAVLTLFRQSLATAYGIGRDTRAKVPPVTVLLLAVVPAIVGVALIALARQLGQAGAFVEEASPIQHDSYYGIVASLTVLFCAIQAPEIIGRDIRHHVHALYFSRAVERLDYTLARLGGLVAAILVLALTPQLIIAVGLILSAKDLAAAVGDELAAMPAILAQGVFLALVLGSISSAVSAYIPRRAYAAATIVAALGLTTGITEAAIRASEGLGRILVLLSPADVLSGTNAFFFGTSPDSDAIQRADLPEVAFLVSAVVLTLVATGILVRKIRGIVA